MEDVTGVKKRKQSLAPFFQDYATSTRVEPESLLFSTISMDDISVPGQTSRKKVMRNTKTTLIVYMRDRLGTRKNK